MHYSDVLLIFRHIDNKFTYLLKYLYSGDQSKKLFHY